jgi:hypothetical protein
MNYIPVVKAVRRVAGGRLGEKHTVILFDEVESGGGIQYKFVVGVFSNEDHEPVFFVASETNSLQKLFGGPSHFMGVFDGDGHGNMGADEAWADADKFFPAAVQVAKQAFMPAAAAAAASDAEGKPGEPGETGEVAKAVARVEMEVTLTPRDQETAAQTFDMDRMQAAFLRMATTGEGLTDGGPKAPSCVRTCLVRLVIVIILITAVVVLVRMIR